MRQKGRVVIPAGAKWKGELVSGLLTDLAHEELVHVGERPTWHYLRSRFIWPRMRPGIRMHISACDACQRSKRRTTAVPGTMQTMSVEGRLGEHIGLDFVGLFKTKTHGAVTANMITHFIDRPSGLSMFLPSMETATAEDVATLFVQRVYPVWGLPKSILSDRDTKFQSRFWTAVMRELGPKLAKTTSWHPRTNGQTERRHDDMAAAIRAVVDRDQTNWLAKMPLSEFRCNATQNRTSGYSAFECTRGFNPMALPEGIPADTGVPAADRWLQELLDNRADAEDAIATERLRREVAENVGKPPTPQYQEGDAVMLSAANLKFKHGTRKLRPLWLGPLKVRGQRGKTVELELPPQWKIFPKFDVGLLKKYVGAARFTDPQPELDEEGMEAYEVASLESLRWNKRRKRWEWLTRWTGYAPTDDTWEPLENLSGCPDILAEFRRSRGEERGLVGPTLPKLNPGSGSRGEEVGVVLPSVCRGQAGTWV